jgi:hypothetical protein
MPRLTHLSHAGRTRVALTLAALGAIVAADACGTRGMRRRPGSDVVVREPGRVTDMTARRPCRRATDTTGAALGELLCRAATIDTTPRRPGDSETGQPPRPKP